MKNKYYEVRVKSYLLQDIKATNAQELIGNILNCSMIDDEYLSKIHLEKSLFKNYCFSGLYPIENDRVYKANNVYQFLIRSNDEKLIQNLRTQLIKQRNSYIIILSTEIKEWSYNFINQLQTYTPSVLTFSPKDKLPEILSNIKTKNKYWIKGCGQKLLIERIEKNLIKKYKFFYNKEINEDENIVMGITIRNYMPITIKYKGAVLIGNTLNIDFDSNEVAQKLARVAIINGVLEKNASLGCGFVKAI